MSMDPKVKQKTLRLLTNGIYILTSRSHDAFGAATITWVSQASFRPPLLMAAIRLDSSVYRCLSASRVATLHVLGKHQKQIAQKFFTPTRGGSADLNGEPFFEGQLGAPILENLPAYMECRVVDIREEYGDHALVIFEVINAVLLAEVDPLTIPDSPWEYGG